MKNTIKLILLTMAAFSAVITGQNALALAAQETEGDRYHFTNRWAYGCVPYTISNGARDYLAHINHAIQEWDSKLTSVSFYPKDDPGAPARCSGITKTLAFVETAGACGTPSNDAHGAPLEGDIRKIELSNTLLGCMATDNQNTLSRNVTHEIGHALGFVHEHQRADAALYVKVIAENTNSTQELRSEAQNSRILSDIYDYESIMHYHPTAWGKTLNGEKLTTLEFINTDYPPPPDIEYILANGISISQNDRIAANQFYAPGVADIGVLMKREAGCSQARHNDNKCPSDMGPHQAKLQLQMINHGPYDSGAVEIFHDLPAAASSVQILNDESDGCTVNGLRIRCDISNMAPVTQITANILVTLINDEKHTYVSRVNAVDANDDFATNDMHEMDFDTKSGGSITIFGLLSLAALMLRRRNWR